MQATGSTCYPWNLRPALPPTVTYGRVQRRYGLDISAAVATIARHAERGNMLDCKGDAITLEAVRGVPHDMSLEVWYDAAQATATGPVIMGDKSKADDYKIYSARKVPDIIEPRKVHGGRDLLQEKKCYNPIVLIGASNGAPLRGATHGFGNTEESIFLKNYGRGDGDGEYHDALHVKRNELDLTIHEIFGGFNHGACGRLDRLARRSKRIDHTEYVAYNATAFAAH